MKAFVNWAQETKCQAERKIMADLTAAAQVPQDDGVNLPGLKWGLPWPGQEVPLWIVGDSRRVN